MFACDEDERPGGKHTHTSFHRLITEEVKGRGNMRSHSFFFMNAFLFGNQSVINVIILNLQLLLLLA